MAKMLRCALALCLMHGAAAYAAPGAYAQVFGESTTISLNQGGTIELFMDAAQEVLQEHRKIKINGACLSACVIFADLARKNICITPQATFGFHKASKNHQANYALSGELPYLDGAATMFTRVMLTIGYIDTYRYDPPASADILGWVAQHGGFPTNGFLLMRAEEATQFWPLCQEKE